MQNYNNVNVVSGFSCYNFNDKLHRIDGPAIHNKDFSHQEWWINGVLHRDNGPAIEYVDGHKQYFLFNKEYSEESFHDYINSLKLPDYFKEK